MKLDQVNYVSNFSSDQKTGGWDGINHFLVSALREKCQLNYCHIDPPKDRWSTFLSRVEKFAGRPRRFPLFSEGRLDVISQEIVPHKENLFFFGSTPWAKCRPSKPYFVYTDICFAHYVDLYLSSEVFDAKDISRITELESQFLTNAQCVFWGSNWARLEAQRRYRQDFKNSRILKTGGNVSATCNTDLQVVTRQRALLFVSLNFVAKGGLFAFELFKEMVSDSECSNLEFWIVGQRPPDAIVKFPGVRYFGHIDKSSDEGEAKLKSLYKRATLLIHLSQMDTMGAVLVEAGYFGLPSITLNQFGMPEMISASPYCVLVEPSEVHQVDQMIAKVKQAIDELLTSPHIHDEVRNYFVAEMGWGKLSETIMQEMNMSRSA